MAAYCVVGPRAVASRPATKSAAGVGEGVEHKAVDLTSTWNREWENGCRLQDSSAPLPRVASEDAESGAERRREVASRGSPANTPPWWPPATVRRSEGEGGGTAGWLGDRWRAAKEAYREADRQVELSEFLLERPKALVLDVVTALVELHPYGKTITTGYKLHGAVKDTSEDVFQIVSEAPSVLVHGGDAEIHALSRRAMKAPVNFLNAVWDDVTSKAPKARDGDEEPGE